MAIFAYVYREPYLDELREAEQWPVEIDKLYRDLGQRQQWLELRRDCQTQTPAALYLQSLEQLGESGREISDRLGEIEALGIEVIALNPPYSSSLWRSNEPQEQQKQLRELFCTLESYLQKRRMQRGHARNRLHCLPPPGKAPYGYRRGQERYLIDRTTAPVVKDFFAQFLLYGSLRGAVRYLEKRYGKKIAVSTGRNWLTNPIYRGDLAYGGREIIRDTHSPILSRSEAAQIDRLLNRNSQLPSRSASASRSLAGLVICAQCQTKMTVARVTRRQQKHEYLYLRPQQCHHQLKCRAIAYQAVLEATIENICQYLPQAVAEAAQGEVEEQKQSLEAKIAQKQGIIREIDALESQKILDQTTAQLRCYQLQTEIATLKQQAENLPPANLGAIAKTVSIPEFWFDLSEAERRFYFREFIKQIQIERSGDRGEDWVVNLQFIFF